MPHIHEKIDFCAEVFVVYNDTVLLRKHDKYKIWCSVGGHIELDEDPTQAAVREVKEEVGLDITLVGNKLGDNGEEIDLIAPLFVNRHRINEKHEHVAFYFVGRAQTNKLHLSESEKSDECKWFTKAELEANTEGLRAFIRHYALGALAFAKKHA